MNQRNFSGVLLFDYSNAIRSKSKQSNSMKKTLLIVASILAPLALQAQDTTEEKAPKRERKGPPAEVVAKFDADGDGVLNETERTAAKDARKAEMKAHKEAMLAKYDTDKDGEFSKEERKAMMIDRFDTDKDGKLSATEKEAAKKASMMRRGPHGEGKGKGKGKGPKEEEVSAE